MNESSRNQSQVFMHRSSMTIPPNAKVPVNQDWKPLLVAKCLEFLMKQRLLQHKISPRSPIWSPSDIIRYMFTWWPYLPWKCGQTLPVELTEPVAKISHLDRPVGSVARVENTRCCSNNQKGMMDPWDSEKNRDGWKHSIQWNDDGSPTLRVPKSKTYLVGWRWVTSTRAQ